MGTVQKYNKRDVEVEMSIQQKLSRFPVPDSVWDEYHIDQEINDRGILLDMDVVTNAIKFDAFSKARLMGTLKDKTELENPNSVTQMKDWLISKGVETDSLDKKAVIELFKTVPSDVADVLKLRQQLAKSSVKNIRLCRTLYVPMAVPEVCSSFMVQTDLADGRDALSSYRTCHKTT